MSDLTYPQSGPRDLNTNQKTFDLRRSSRELFRSVVGPGAIPRKRMGIRHAEPRAEKRVSFRGVLKRHLSVVFWRVRETVEILGGAAGATAAFAYRGGGRRDLRLSPRT
jgi:hypothetical protein